MAFFPFSGQPKLTAEVTVTPSQITAGANTESTFTVTGLRKGMIVLVDFPSLEANLVQNTARVTADNTLKVRFYNPTGSTITPSSQTMRVVAF